jgi:hypothetical protein
MEINAKAIVLKDKIFHFGSHSQKELVYQKIQPL